MKGVGKRVEEKKWLPGQTLRASDCTPSQSASTCCWSATKRGEGSVRKRYADRRIERHKERGGCEIESSVRKCTRYPPNLPMLTHAQTHSCWPLPLGSVSPRRRPVAPLAQCPSQGSCVPAGSDGHGAQWAPLPLWSPANNSSLYKKGSKWKGGRLLWGSHLAIGGKKEMIRRSRETQHGGDRNRVNGDCC